MSLCLILLLSFPLQAFAYSYGDPTKEDIAETFNLILGKLSTASPDWEGAHEAYKVRRAEISSHFGESITVTLDQNFKMKQKDLLISNYRYVLYKNIERRLNYARKDINDYGKAKLLMGKAKGTFDVLKPYVQGKIASKVPAIDASLENALKALGNPGLFGVGEEPVMPEEFDKEAAFILNTLKPIFPYTPAKAEEKPKEKEPETSPEETETEATKETKTEVKEQPQEKKVEAPKTEEKTSEKAVASSQTSEEKKDVKSDAPPESKKEVKDTNEDKKIEEQGTSTTTVAEVKENEETTEETKEATESAEETTTEEQTEEKAEASETEKVVAEVTETASPDTEHSAMERTSKTNPMVTIIVIGTVLILGVGGLWFLRKQQII